MLIFRWQRIAGDHEAHWFRTNIPMCSHSFPLKIVGAHVSPKMVHKVQRFCTFFVDTCSQSIWFQDRSYCENCILRRKQQTVIFSNPRRANQQSRPLHNAVCSLLCMSNEAFYWEVLTYHWDNRYDPVWINIDTSSATEALSKWCHSEKCSPMRWAFVSRIKDWQRENQVNMTEIMITPVNHCFLDVGDTMN